MRLTPCAPGSGGTYTSGSTRVTDTWATSHTSAGSAPCWIKNTSEANRAPSCIASTFVTTPEICTPGCPGSSRRVITTSSSCAYCPGASPTENPSGVAGTVPTTSPSAASPSSSPVTKPPTSMLTCRPSLRPARCPLRPATENLYAERSMVPAPAQTPRVPGGTLPVVAASTDDSRRTPVPEPAGGGRAVWRILWTWPTSGLPSTRTG